MDLRHREEASARERLFPGQGCSQAPNLLGVRAGLPTPNVAKFSSMTETVAGKAQTNDGAAVRTPNTVITAAASLVFITEAGYSSNAISHGRYHDSHRHPSTCGSPFIRRAATAETRNGPATRGLGRGGEPPGGGGHRR